MDNPNSSSGNDNVQINNNGANSAIGVFNDNSAVSLNDHTLSKTMPNTLEGSPIEVEAIKSITFNNEIVVNGNLQSTELHFAPGAKVTINGNTESETIQLSPGAEVVFHGVVQGPSVGHNTNNEQVEMQPLGIVEVPADHEADA